MSYSVVVDAGALIAFEKRNRTMIRIAQSLLADRAVIVTSAGVVAQVWRDPAKQGALAYFMAHVRVVDLSLVVARHLGRMMAIAKTSDVVDAHVVHLAREHRCAVLTSDPLDLRALDPSLRIETV